MLQRAARHAVARHSRRLARPSSLAAAASALPATAAAAAQLPFAISFTHACAVAPATASGALAGATRGVSTARTLCSPAAAADSSAAAAASADAEDEPPYLAPNWKKLPDWAEPPQPQLISLGDLQPNRGATKKAKRYGRGPGSGLGKTAGKGHKGQGQRKGNRKWGFEGGSTPFWRRVPKLGNTTAARHWKMLTPLPLQRIVDFVHAGRIDAEQLITMKTLVDAGCVRQVEHGIKLLSGGLTSLPRPLHLQLSDCSEQARSVLESSGGSVHLVWFNRVTLRAHLQPLRFLRKYGRLPRHTGVPPPKKAAKYGYVVEHVEY